MLSVLVENGKEEWMKWRGGVEEREKGAGKGGRVAERGRRKERKGVENFDKKDNINDRNRRTVRETRMINNL